MLRSLVGSEMCIRDSLMIGPESEAMVLETAQELLRALM